MEMKGDPSHKSVQDSKKIKLCSTKECGVSRLGVTLCIVIIWFQWKAACDFWVVMTVDAHDTHDCSANKEDKLV